jgi:16S rRNA G527 N7-methylase RsmG
MSSRAFRGHLEARARLANCFMPPDLIARLETYYSLLQVWNRAINLAGMAPADDNAAALDRLLIEPVLGARACPPDIRRVIDVGSGGGLTGDPAGTGAGDVVSHDGGVESEKGGIPA